MQDYELLQQVSDLQKRVEQLELQVQEMRRLMWIDAPREPEAA